MYRLILVIFLSVIFFSCDIRNNKRHTDVIAKEALANFKDTTSIQIIDSIYNFGKITDGEKVEYNFRFKNTGNKPLIISAARASCGCTVPEKPEAPIPPGEIGFLKVVFDSKGRIGTAHKDIRVTSNASPAFPLLMLVGEVMAKDKG
jgi:hypothetical protein